MIGPQATLLPDGRLHLQHGPIDLIIDCQGPDREAALEAARARFATILQELVDELPALRRPAQADTRLEGPTARRMQAAVAPLLPRFITPMAAVAGAVADEMLAAVTAGNRVNKAWINNGGDIAFHLGAGERAIAALAGLPGGRIAICADDPWRGIATSGWRGRSHCLGIADTVTVIAQNAAGADAAATIIANAVDLPGHPAIERKPATLLLPDSDLGNRPVTTAVGPLTTREAANALQAGSEVAGDLLGRELIGGAVLALGGQWRLCGALEELDGPSGAAVALNAPR